VQQHTPGSTIQPVIVSVQPGQLGKPEISQNLYECGVSVPVSKLFPCVGMHIDEDSVKIGSKPADRV